MSSSKQRRKARRQAEKQMHEAWLALAGGRQDLALRRSEQALAAGFVNPRFWKDRGQILAACGETEDAAAALERAVALAPGYSEAMAALAPLEAARGDVQRAAELQAEVVAAHPDDDEAARRLAEYRAEAARWTIVPAEPAPPDDAPVPGERTATQDWDVVARELRERGAARLPGLLTAEESASLIALWDDADAFEHEVRVDHEERGRVVYRFFARPLPSLVAELRAEVYARLAPIANDWQELLGSSERFPRNHGRFLWECHRAGQSRTTPILLRYESGGHNGLHRDAKSPLAFPFQLAVTLARRSSARGHADGAGHAGLVAGGAGAQKVGIDLPGAGEQRQEPDPPGAGGELLLADDRGGKLRTRARVAAAPGDGVLFCSRERMVDIGGVPARQPVLHGVAPTPTERFALGIVFQDER